MWRRVASQSPQFQSGPKDAYVKAFSALGQMLRDGRSLSGHERNCCFLNTRDNRFATVSAASGLDFADDGRAIGLTDWDHDGDVDVWLANRTNPRLRFMRNDTHRKSGFVTFKLTGVQCNRDALGARLELYLTRPSESPDKAELKLIRTVRAGSGFLSQCSKRIHFGIGKCGIEKLRVRWPDGSSDQFENISSGHHYLILQGSGNPTEWVRSKTNTSLSPTTIQPATISNQSRIVITARLPMPKIARKEIQSDSKRNSGNLTLVNLWSTTCSPCVEELAEFSKHATAIRNAGINIQALNVDELMENPTSDLSRAKQILDEIAFHFDSAAIDTSSSGILDLFHQAFLSLRRPLPIPSSFLTTPDGRIAVVYRGPVSVQQLIKDAEVARTDDPQALRSLAVSFDGKWYGNPITTNPKRHATAFMRNGFLDQGAEYLEQYLRAHLKQEGWGPRDSWPSQKALAELCDTLANFYRLQKQPNKLIGIYQVALKFDPDFVPSLVNLGKVLIGQRKTREGLLLLERAMRLTPSDAVITSDLAIAYVMTGQTEKAEDLFLKLLERETESPGTRLNLGRLYYQSGRFTEAAVMLREHLDRDRYSTEAMRLLGWIRVSSPVKGDRDPSQAKELAQRLKDRDDIVAAHDLIGAVYAELGDFQNAATEARLAIEACRKNGDTATRAKIEQRLKLYLQGTAFRLR